MKLFFRSLTAVLLLFVLTSVSAQEKGPVQFSYAQERLNAGEVQLKTTLLIPPGVKLYALQQSEDDVLFSSIVYDSASQRYVSGKPAANQSASKENDPTLQADVQYYTDSVTWLQTIKAKASDSFLLKGTINYMYKKGDQYIPVEEDLKVFVLPTKEAVASTNTGAADSEETEATRSLWWIFFTAFAGGLLALLTPCVYAMIPVTVSFFTKRSKTKAEGIRNALIYSASIVFIFTLLGFLITVIFGPAALNLLATNWIANMVFFAIFLVFAFSFLGAFEITLPSSWGNKADTKAGMGSFAGIFFMALTLVIVSFSCTGPIIGNLLVLAAKGSYWGPLTGMFGFSTALALPFALFAFFPSKLNVLGKSGGWLNGVKVTLGFLELALALKFLSNADLSQGWRILDREIFISLWIVIFMLLGVYLLGKIKFSHDDELPKNDFGIPYLTVTRFMLALTAFGFAVYMIPGLWGAPLKGISAFVPPMGTQDFVVGAGNKTTAGTSSTAGESELPHPVKYYEQMRIFEPEVVTKYGMVTYFDYEEALAVARKVKRPLMLDFTGINCVNCRKMEGQVWSDPEVMKRLKEDFVIASLYVDVHRVDLQPGDQYYSEALGKQVETVGDRSTDIQVSKFNANSQPFYFFLDGNEEKLAPNGYGYDPDIKKFIQLLDGVKEAYNKKAK